MNQNIIDEFKEIQTDMWNSRETALLMIIDRLDKLILRIDTIEKVLRNGMR